MKNISFFLVLVMLSDCDSKKSEFQTSLKEQASNTETITGATEYINSPYVTAGNRVYMVGHQDGSFPDLGWHVKGEMGGIWDHPIKLMDGFQVQLILDGDSICLSEAESFVNYPLANEHQYLLNDLEISRFQFVPDNKEGVVIEYSLKTIESAAKIGLVFTGMVDLMPVWLSEKAGLEDGRDEARYNQNYEAIVAKDKLNDWFVAFGSDRRPDFHGIGGNPCDIKNRGNGAYGSLRYDFSVEKGKTEVIRFFIGGSSEAIDSLWRNYDEIKVAPVELLQNKLNRYKEIAEKSRLVISDKGLEKVYRWTKYNTDWLMRDVPEVGNGLSAGIPDYPWWFGADNAYSIQGLLASGMHEEALATIDLVMSLSREVNGANGRIMHEASTNGVVFNPGNLNETPHFIHTLWKAYEWTADQSIVDNYYDDIKKGIAWIESQDKDGNGYPDGPGMMEIHGLHYEMIDVVVYQAAAYTAAANFARVVGDIELSASYKTKALRLESKINSDWWVEEFDSYADFRASKNQTIELIEAAIIRADTINKPWAITELEATLKNVRLLAEDEVNGHVVHHNWVVNTPMEMQLAHKDKALQALETARNYRNRFGMYVTGMDRDESQEKAEKWQSFSYVGAVMTLPTGVQAIAEANYGNADEALIYLKMLENSFSYALPGAMYEVSPDYGMMVQAWNIYAVAVPVVEKFFGIQPRAYNKKIIVTPLMPKSWKTAILSNVQIGDNELTIEKSTNGNSESYVISQTQPIWEIDFVADRNSKISLNGTPITADSLASNLVTTFSGQENLIVIQK